MAETPKRLNHDEALERLEAAFDHAHPSESLPDWFFGTNRVVNVTHRGYEIHYAVAPFMPLTEDQQWVEGEYGDYIEGTDTETGRKGVTISRTPPHWITLFKAHIDTRTHEIKVLHDVDWSTLKAEGLELPRPVKGIPIWVELTGQWSQFPTTDRAEALRVLTPEYRHTMPSRIIRDATDSLPLKFGKHRPHDADALEAALTELGLTIERKVLAYR